MISALLRIQNHLAIATKMAVLTKLADNMMTTYLGGDAGRRVLDGQIKRGEGDTIRAALVMGDMRGSTRLAQTSGREVYIDTLNQFFGAIAAPFNREGGQIMSFRTTPSRKHRAQSGIACQAALGSARGQRG
jgi:adenylate cyclase